MNIRNFSLMMIPVVFLISCNSTVVNFSTSYSMDKAPATCAVVFPPKIVVQYDGDVEDEFGKGDRKVLIADFFRRQMINEVSQQTVFDRVFGAKITNDFTQQVFTIKTGKGTKSFFAPKAGEKIECDGRVPDIVLLLDEVEISSHFNMNISSGSSYGGFSSGPSFSSKKNLIVEAKFMIYDNRKTVLVAHGFMEIVDKNSFAVTLDDWMDVMTKTVITMFGQSPLHKR